MQSNKNVGWVYYPENWDFLLKTWNNAPGTQEEKADANYYMYSS